MEGVLEGGQGSSQGEVSEIFQGSEMETSGEGVAIEFSQGVVWGRVEPPIPPPGGDPPSPPDSPEPAGFFSKPWGSRRFFSFCNGPVEESQQPQ